MKKTLIKLVILAGFFNLSLAQANQEIIECDTHSYKSESILSFEYENPEVIINFLDRNEVPDLDKRVEYIKSCLINIIKQKDIKEDVVGSSLIGGVDDVGLLEEYYILYNAKTNQIEIESVGYMH